MEDIKIRKVVKHQKEDKIKVMWFSNDINMFTGFSKVTNKVCTSLSKDPRFEVIHISENYNGAPYDKNGIKILGVPPQGPAGTEIVESCVKHMNHFNPDYFVALEDTFTLDRYRFFQINFEGIKFIPYVPLDGRYIPTASERILRKSDSVVSMAKFTQSCLKEEGFDSEMIWHGVDEKMFNIPTKEEKSLLRKKWGYKDDDFIVFNYSRNSMRKRPNRLLEACADVCVNNPKVKCLFHIMGYKMVDGHLEDFIKRHMYFKHKRDLIKEGRIQFTKGTETIRADIPESTIAEWIKMSDLVASGSSGEGFGMISVEAMACGKPVVITDYTTPKELLIDGEPSPRGKLVDYDTLDIAGYNTEHALVNIKSLKEGIEYYVKNPNKLKEHGSNGREFVLKHLTWDNIVNQWKEFFIKNS